MHKRLKKTNMKKILFLLIITIFSTKVFSQDYMKIRLNDGTIVTYMIAEIDSLIYYNIDTNFASCGELIDFDGNVYQTVIIGTQCWMQENLKVTHYSDGTEIPNVNSNSSWNTLLATDTSKAYCWYNDNIDNIDNGALYTYAAAVNEDITGSNTQGACPNGWHVPNIADLDTLFTFLGTNTGSKLAKDTSLWYNGSLVNDIYLGYSGFFGIPFGYRGASGGFINHGSRAIWWCSEAFSTTTLSHCMSIDYDNTEVLEITISKDNGLYIRCVRDY